MAVTPRALDDYEIFGDTVHSPCAGTVRAVRTSVPDHAPGDADTERPEGNYIVVKCDAVEILMAHLKQGSISVSTGDAVSLGQPLGQVGNSGNTLEPHLHIGARKDGAEVGLVVLALLTPALGTPAWTFGGDSHVHVSQSFGRQGRAIVFGFGPGFPFRPHTFHRPKFFHQPHFFPHRHGGFFLFGFQKAWKPGQWVEIPKGVGV